MGSLTVVSTPIGNLEDIGLRALRVLREADAICAEDTRVTRKLLSRYDIHTPLVSYHRHSLARRTEEVLGMLRAGKSVALVSDAGTPGISDPGADLVRLAAAEGQTVTAVPGPSAVLAALGVSGLPTGRFAFDGYPPRARSDRTAFFAGLRGEARTVVLYEAPLRVEATLRDLLEALGDREVCIGRELTKVFEDVYRGTLTGALERVRQARPRGEYTLVIAPPSACDAAAPPPPEEAVASAVRIRLQAGMSVADAAREVAAELGVPRRRAYTAALTAARAGAAALEACAHAPPNSR
ncbi:MAG TPA: 16S rRNA (cytidine(1402)-2'-O)-methyltransferase [Chthonomonadales bacterium]|nr:16S rRNA (cytidine(1402)-2'-O)-methyltransferase [Chthonomonadales bacterium]